MEPNKMILEFMKIVIDYCEGLNDYERAKFIGYLSRDAMDYIEAEKKYDEQLLEAYKKFTKQIGGGKDADN